MAAHDTGAFDAEGRNGNVFRVIPAFERLSYRDWFAALTPSESIDVNNIRAIDDKGVVEMGINKDQVEGRAKEISGKLQEDLGKVTDNKTEQVKGLVNRVVGVGQAKAGDLAEKMQDAVEGP
jgi:uncharacterized protein YjbJ (UPF0337 family)